MTPKLYRVTRTTKHKVWPRWSAPGDNPPRGMSLCVPITEFASGWDEVGPNLYRRRPPIEEMDEAYLFERSRFAAQKLIAETLAAHKATDNSTLHFP